VLVLSLRERFCISRDDGILVVKDKKVMMVTDGTGYLRSVIIVQY